jgi:hypothetical protein
MVEGPQCHLKAQALGAACAGQAVAAAEGSAAPPVQLQRCVDCVLQRCVPPMCLHCRTQ